MFPLWQLYMHYAEHLNRLVCVFLRQVKRHLNWYRHLLMDCPVILTSTVTAYSFLQDHTFRKVFSEAKIPTPSLFFLQVPVTSWFDDPNDSELLDLIPFFEALDKVDNVLTVLGRSQLQTPSPTSSQNDPSFHDPQQEEL